MILIADSGSTKCDWMFVGPDRNSTTNTIGFNPFFHNQSFIESKLLENHDLNRVKEKITEIYFYGAGCSSSERNNILSNALSTVFFNASVIEVKEDMAGAAYATTGGAPGIVCIIGTGSNACYFDGHQVHNRIPALGYVLGDEASGSFFGKKMLSSYLYGRMPTRLSSDFQKIYGVDKESILTSVYNKPNANVYLASFMKFASENRNDAWINEMMHDGFTAFADIHILSHPEHAKVPVNFVGSIAYYFKDEMSIVAQEMGFTIGNIVQKPIEALTKYHQDN